MQDSEHLTFVINLLLSFAAITVIRAIVLSLFAIAKVARWAFRARVVVASMFIAFVATIAKAPVLNAVYYVYTRYFEVVKARPSDDADALFLRAAHAELRRQAGDYAAEKTIAWTRHTAEQLGCKEENIYAVALLECSLNPFRVRDDNVAAGWLQFTRAGLSGMGVSLEQVIAACRARDIDFIMSLSHKYLLRRQAQANVNLNTEIDVYLAVFAPALINAPPNRIIYAGKNNPAYYMNKGLDGWRLSRDGTIYKQAPDGDITVEELYLAMTRKKQLLMYQYAQ